MPLVTMPNGDRVRFPDEMPRDQISTFIEEKFPGTFSGQQEAQPEPQAQEPQAPRNYALSEVPGAAWSNVGRNTGEIGGAIANRYSEVGATGIAKDIGKTVIGMGQEFVPGQQQYETEYADPLYKKLLQDWGWNEKSARAQYEQIKRHVAEQPVQAALDASMVMAPAESVPGRVGAAARIVNPVNVAGRTVSTVAKLPAKTAKYWAGEVSGVGPRTLEEAYRSGKVGGVEGQAFREQARGYGDANAPVDTARGVVGDLRKERSAEYTGNMAGIKANPTRLNFQPIQQAYGRNFGIQRFRGKELDPATAGVRKEIGEALAEWKADPGAHTAEGFDALKQRIQSIGERQTPNSPASTIAGRVANSVKDEITKQAPEYAGAMKAYSRASTVIDELTRTFSLGNKATYDTSLRKLQSVLRNNAWTNWSARAKLAKEIEQRAPTLMPALSGQAVNTWMPRGLAGKLLTGGTVSGAALATAVMANPMILVPLFASMAGGSPRVVGEIAHGAGRVAGGVSRGYRSKTGTAARVVGAATPRIAAIEHTKTVLSPEAFNNLGRDPATRGELAKWVQAKTAGNGMEEAAIALADSIAQKVNQPELAERIARELLGAE